MSSRLPFMFPVRVYWEDTDAGGVVYHANYVCFLERARSEWLRAAGITQEALRRDHDLLFAVRAMQLDFLRPARLDDGLEVTIDRVELRAASLVFVQRVVRSGEPEVLATARVRCACLRATDFRPRPMPSALAARLLGSDPSNTTNVPE
jgi:acyl-CoA thioester hydrolase